MGEGRVCKSQWPQKPKNLSKPIFLPSKNIKRRKIRWAPRILFLVYVIPYLLPSPLSQHRHKSASAGAGQPSGACCFFLVFRSCRKTRWLKPWCVLLLLPGMSIEHSREHINSLAVTWGPCRCLLCVFMWVCAWAPPCILHVYAWHFVSHITNMPQSHVAQLNPSILCDYILVGRLDHFKLPICIQ